MNAEREPRPACHRFYVPLQLQVPAIGLDGRHKRDLANPNAVQMEIRPQVANSECIGAGCMLWNPDRLECYDKTQARAISRIADNYSAPQGQ